MRGQFRFLLWVAPHNIIDILLGPGTGTHGVIIVLTPNVNLKLFVIPCDKNTCTIYIYNRLLTIADQDYFIPFLIICDNNTRQKCWDVIQMLLWMN